MANIPQKLPKGASAPESPSRLERKTTPVFVATSGAIVAAGWEVHWLGVVAMAVFGYFVGKHMVKMQTKDEKID